MTQHLYMRQNMFQKRRKINKRRKLIRALNKLTPIIALFFLISCSHETKGQVKNDSYNIEKYTSKIGSHLKFQSFHSDDRKVRCYSIYRINGVIFSNHNLNDLSYDVIEGNYNISVGAVGKEWIDLKNIHVKKGDSLVIKFYLKDDTNSLHTPEYVPGKKKNKEN